MASKPKDQAGANMATSPAVTTGSDRPRDALLIYSKSAEEFDGAIARDLTRPEVLAASTIQRIQSDHEINALAKISAVKINKINIINEKKTLLKKLVW